MVSALLTPHLVTLHNVPRNLDVAVLAALLQRLGCDLHWSTPAAGLSLTLSADRVQPGRIDAETRALARGEADDRDHLVKGHRKAVLGRQAIIDRQRGNPALMDKLAQHRIPARDTALHKPAAVRIDEQWRPLGIVRQIEAARHLSVRTRQAQIPLALQRDGPFA